MPKSFESFRQEKIKSEVLEEKEKKEQKEYLPPKFLIYEDSYYDSRGYDRETRLYNEKGELLKEYKYSYRNPDPGYRISENIIEEGEEPTEEEVRNAIVLRIETSSWTGPKTTVRFFPNDSMKAEKAYELIEKLFPEEKGEYIDPKTKEKIYERRIPGLLEDYVEEWDGDRIYQGYERLSEEEAKKRLSKLKIPEKLSEVMLDLYNSKNQ